MLDIVVTIEKLNQTISAVAGIVLMHRKYCLSNKKPVSPGLKSFFDKNFFKKFYVEHHE